MSYEQTQRLRGFPDSAGIREARRDPSTAFSSAIAHENSAQDDMSLEGAKETAAHNIRAAGQPRRLSPHKSKSPLLAHTPREKWGTRFGVTLKLET